MLFTVYNVTRQTIQNCTNRYSGSGVSSVICIWGFSKDYRELLGGDVRDPLVIDKRK